MSDQSEAEPGRFLVSKEDYRKIPWGNEVMKADRWDVDCYDNRRRAPLIWVLEKVVGLMGAMTRWHINWLVAFLRRR